MSNELQLPEKYQGRDDEEELKEKYKEMLFEPGEAAGIVGAQSISEPATQMTMETYHSAGAAKVSITLGLPRLIEIIDARRNPKTPVMDIYLEEDYQTEEKARELATKIQTVTFQDIISEDSFDMTSLELEFVMDEDVLDEFMIDRADVKDKLESKLKNTHITIEENVVRMYPDEEDYDLTDLQDLKKKSADIRLKGIKSIDHVVLLEEDGEWRIQSAGINLRKVLKLDGVDATRTTCNDFFEILKVFGVEAARQNILNEMNSTLDEQGINVDIRWLMMLADTMTKEGDVQGATRYGIVGNKSSVLARSSFEETKKHLTQAALHGEEDPIASVVENIIVGQVIPVGTGQLELKAEPGKAEPVEEPTIPMQQPEPDFEDEEEEDEESSEPATSEEESGEEVDEDEENMSDDELDVDETVAQDVSDMTVAEAKEAVEEDVLDPADALEQERDGKDRSTLTDWLERRAEEQTGEETEEAPEQA